MHRAFSIFVLKDANSDTRTLTGIATTPETDSVGDVVEPLGAEFKLPLPLLWQHDSTQPIGNVTRATVSPTGISITAQIAQIAEAGLLKNRLDEAWQSIKSGLVRGLSIGFSPIEMEPISNRGGYSGLRFLRWAFRELSAVTIPANQSATIQTIKSSDARHLRSMPRGAVFSLREMRTIYK